MKSKILKFTTIFQLLVDFEQGLQGPAIHAIALPPSTRFLDEQTVV